MAMTRSIAFPRFWLHCSMAIALALSLPATSHARERASDATGVPGIDEAQLSADFWLQQLEHPDAVLLDSALIQAQNARLLQRDESMHDLAAFPAELPATRVRGWTQAYDATLQRTLFHEVGTPVTAADVQQLRDAMAIDTLPDRQQTRFGLVVRRAPLRAAPTAMRAFSRAGETDIDRFQESAEFPGTPVVIAPRSRDGQWLFVASPRYAAWMPADAVAEGTRETVLDYGRATPYRVITDAKPRTVFTREQPRVSELQLDMGVRIPLDTPPEDGIVNGQHAYTGWVLRLPVRQEDGRLAFAQALLPKSAGSSADYLPLTRANLVRQAFKFLGERYGWGHSYNGRDCSGFVAEVYRSMGVMMPRNTGDQARSPAFDHTLFDAASTRQQREAAVAALQTGDLIYIPGHVMMMLGRIDGQPYVIHDTNGGSLRTTDGSRRSLGLNGVVVTPLEPMLYNDSDRYIDRITSIVRMRTETP